MAAGTGSGPAVWGTSRRTRVNRLNRKGRRVGAVSRSTAKAHSAVKRRALAQKLGLPENLSSNALLQALDLLMSREELAKLAGALEMEP